MVEKIPSYIELSDDGAVIKLSSKKTKIGGILVDHLKMTMPTAGILRISQVKHPASNADQEAYIFSSICSITTEELDTLIARDYSRVQLAYRFLVSELGEVEDGHQGSNESAGNQTALPTL